MLDSARPATTTLTVGQLLAIGQRAVALHEFAEAEDIKMGQIIHAVRVAVTGKPTGPGMFDCLELLGRERVLNRLKRALERV